MAINMLDMLEWTGTEVFSSHCTSDMWSVGSHGLQSTVPMLCSLPLLKRYISLSQRHVLVLVDRVLGAGNMFEFNRNGAFLYITGSKNGYIPKRTYW